MDSGVCQNAVDGEVYRESFEEIESGIMIFREAVRVACFSMLCFLVSGLTAPLSAQSRVYRDRVEPHWFGQNKKFWYRNELPEGAREFWMVDAEQGSKQPAFDHTLVASKLSELCAEEISATQLPVESLEYTDDSSVIELRTSKGIFLLDSSTGLITKKEGTAESGNVSLVLPPPPSRAGTEDVDLTITNQLSEPVQLVWVDPDRNERSYGELAAGETRKQHTFAGHTWLLRRADGSPIGAFSADQNQPNIVIDEAAVAGVRRIEREGRGRRRRNAEPEKPARSPDGRFEPVVREHNLFLQAVDQDAEAIALTTDAEPSNTFTRDASRARLIGMDYERTDYPPELSEVVWSPDSRFLLAMQTKRVAERQVTYVQSSPRDQLQPIVQTYPYLKPGDEIPVQTPRLFSVEDKREIPLSRELYPNPWTLEFLRWSDDGGKFWMLYNQRGHQVLRVLEVDTATGQVRAIVDEQSPTFIQYSSDGKFELRWLKNQQLLWASERSGWNHLYRIDVQTGTVMNPVTSGDWNVRRIEHIDEDRGEIWFYAVGVRPDQDPYHEHLCRVALDGTGFVILTEGDGTHAVQWSPDRTWMIDQWSRVDQPPVSELRSAADGKMVCRLEEADASEVLKNRGRFTERFVTKGRDGVTDIWGVIHFPKDFDPAKKYGVVENIYAGPHDHHVPKPFRGSYGHQHQIADRGFIVVQIDGMGTAWRSKAFHDVCFQNLRDAGFPDRVLWIKAAAEKYPQMDIDRVGIYGGSAGGQNAMAAVLWHGDFYKAAVADCGCHDNRMDKIWWNEQWMGVPSGDIYSRNSNMENAGLLQGKLMLVVGELDRNVDPATTTQVAGKLIEAGKDFDYLLVVGAGHGACETPWASRKRQEFFERHLGGPK